MTSSERLVEVDIVRNHLRIASELNQSRKGFLRRRRTSNILIVNVSQMSNVLGNRFARIYKRNEPVNDLALLKARGSDLDQLIMSERKASGFGIYDNDILIHRTKVGLRGYLL